MSWTISAECRQQSALATTLTAPFALITTRRIHGSGGYVLNPASPPFLKAGFARLWRQQIWLLRFLWREQLATMTIFDYGFIVSLFKPIRVRE